MPKAVEKDKLTKFGRFLYSMGLSDPVATAAREIGCAKNYVRQLTVTHETLSVRMAARIAVWAKKRGKAYPLEEWDCLRDKLREMGAVKRQRAAPAPQDATEFGRFLSSSGITFRAAAVEIGRSRQFLHVLATGQKEPNLPMAVKIAAWAKSRGGDVPVESWPNLRWAIKEGSEGKK